MMFNHSKHGRMVLLAVCLSLVTGLFSPHYFYQQAEASPLLGDDMEDVSDWTLVNSSNGLMTRYAGASQVIQGTHSMNFRVTDNNNGVNDATSVYKAHSPQLNLSSHDVMSLWIQTDTLSPYLEVQLTDSDGTVSKIALSNVVRGPHLPAEINPDKWYQVFWHFKEDTGTVSGGDGVMNYSAITRTTFASTDGRPVYMNSEKVNFYLDEMNFYADSDLYSQTQIDGMESVTGWLTTAGVSRSLSTAQVKQGMSSIKFTAANNNNGLAEYPSLYRTNVSYDLSGAYELTYWIKPTQNLSFFNVRMTDTDQTSSEFNLAKMFPTAGGTLLANKWYKGRITFREEPGTVTGGNGIMNFEQMKEIVFLTRDSELPTGANTDIHIDDLQSVKYADRAMVDAFDSSSGWTTTPGSTISVNTSNYRDASHAASTFQVPNNNDGIANNYSATKSLSADLSSKDVLSFWILVSEETDKMIFSIKDSDGTTNYIRLDSILWGSQLLPGRWWHLEWPYKTQTDDIIGGNGVMNYSNITGFEVIVDDNTMVKGISNNYFSLDNLETMTMKEWMRSKEEVPMLSPTGNDYAADDFQVGMYNNSNVQPEKTLHDMAKHGVDFIVTHLNHRNDIITKNAGLAQRLGLKVVRQSFPVAGNNSLQHSGLDLLAADDSNQVYPYDPNNQIISYLNANELEVYWPNGLQSNAAEDFSYYAGKIRMNDNSHGIDRRINTHHINYLWYDTGEDHPWFMDWSTLGNYGGFKWTERLKQSAWRMGKTTATNTQSWTPSNLLTNMIDRNYRHVGQAPLDLDEISDFKDSLWTNFEGGLSGIAFFIFDADAWANEWNFVDNDGNPINDRRWGAVTDMSKQIRATESKPYVELTYPRSFEVVEKGTVTVSALAAPSGAPIASVTFEYNDGTNNNWTAIGTDMNSPYTVNWNTSALDLTKKYFVRARAYDGVNYSVDDTSYSVSLVNSGGPAISAAALSSNPTNGLTSIALSATATDSGQAISKIQYYVDTVQKPGQGRAMTASDGTFNSLTEGGTATISIPAIDSTVPLLIDDMSDISDWSGTATRNLEADVLRLDVSNNNNGVSDMRTAIKDYGMSLQNFSQLDTLSFWLKDVTASLTQLQVRMKDSDGTVLEASLPTYYGASSFPADLWKNIRWSFKENYDSIAGGDGSFNFANVKSIEYSVDDSALPASGAPQSIYVDQIRAFAETRWQEQTVPVIYVRAMDSAGNWGPTESVKVNVTNSAAGDTQGPATVVAGTNPHSITDGLSSFLLTANVDDQIDDRGGSRIMAAEYFIDAPGSNGAGTPMGAVDGAFDAMSESVVASVSAAGWAENSKHTLYIHGKDAAGNWGPFYTETIIKTSAQGPKIRNAGAIPSPTQGSATVTLRVIADESETGWGSIAGGEYFVDTLGFEGSGTPMTAHDGTFSGKTEQLTSQINIAGWSTGYHTVYVHAKDSRGKWGPVKTISVLKN